MQRSIGRWGHDVLATVTSGEAVQESAAGAAPGDVRVTERGRRVVVGHSSGDGCTAYCRRCQAQLPVSASCLLSAHSTSAGVVTYFRCPDGHVNLEC